ncbi:MAG TPA: acetyl-CoA carboxylase biotin carboxyl carrier protein subunit [Ramlibacter sp.]|nr:acetyl-CoA carboxylase biotin carboxyl carrier protein subunit [Ramlibacter sp.]
MRADDVEQLSAWLSVTGIDLLELHGPGEHLCLRRSAAGIESVAGNAAPDGLEALAVATAASVGVFLHGHPLRGEPLASAGTVVRAGQVLGLLRVGALLLPVVAPRGGIVAGMLVADGTAVGYGTPLVELQPLENA